MSNKNKLPKGEYAHICLAIDKIVMESGYPVPAQVLKSINLNRSHIRQLLREDILKVVQVRLEKGAPIVNAYYTDNTIPKAITRWEEEEKQEKEEYEVNVRKAKEYAEQLKPKE